MKKLYLLSLLVIFSLNLFCQTHWIKHPDPVMVNGPNGAWDENLDYIGSVILTDNSYMMWYSAWSASDNRAVGLATSEDGITWTRNGNNPVFEIGPEGSWDDTYVSCGDVTMVDDTFHMWYTGWTGTWNQSAIGHAYSVDGINWTRDPENPVLTLEMEGSIENGWIWIDEVVFDGDYLHMWYATADMDIQEGYVGHATSIDGSQWTIDPSNPAILPGNPEDWDYPVVGFTGVVFDGSIFHMWYAGGNNDPSHIYDIGYATSTDGSNWDKYAGNPVMVKGPGSWDAASVFAPNVIDSAGSKYKMWYNGRPLGGGYNAKFGYAETYEPAWQQMASMDIARGRLRSGSIDEMIYVFGGENIDGLVLDSVDVYNTETNEWTNLIPMPEALIETNVEVIHDSMIYVVGGWTVVNKEGKTTNSTIAFYPEGNTWVAKENSPEATGSNASCVLNDTIYILGGKEDFNSTDVRKAWFYDASEDSWSTLPEMIYEHGIDGSANALDGKIYVIGGGTGLTLPMNPVQAEVYVGSTWQEIEDIPIPVLHQISVVHDNKILVIGGDSGAYDHQLGHATNLIQEYDPFTDSWNLYKPMPFNRSAMTGQIVGDYLYLMGGYSSNDRLSSNAISEVWKFNLDSLEVWEVPCTEVILTPASLELKPDSSESLSAIVLPTYAADGTVSWASSNDEVATVTAEGEVTAVSSGEVTITATANGGGCTASCSVSVNPGVGIISSRAGQISVSPNPFINHLDVQTGLSEDYVIEISSLNGQLMLCKEMEGTTQQLDLSSFQKGVYFITIRSKDFVTTRKIVKL